MGSPSGRRRTLPHLLYVVHYSKGAIAFDCGDGSKMERDVKAALVTRSRRGSLARLAVLLAAHRLRL